MIELKITADGERWAREQARKERDADWLKLAVEYELHQWMMQQGIEHAWNYDRKRGAQDFTIGDNNGLKAYVVVNAGKRPRGDFKFVVCKGMDRPVDGVFCVIANARTGRVWVVGYAPTPKTWSVIPTPMLKSALGFFDMLRKCA